MKTSLLLLFVVCLHACAMGGKSIKIAPRKDQDKMWRPCQDFEVQDPVGKLCNRTCSVISKGKCKEWETKIKDMSKKEDFMFLRDGAFICIDEDRIK